MKQTITHVRRWLCLVSVVCLCAILHMAPVALAAAGDVIDSGELCTGINYKITEQSDGTYAISVTGSGKIRSFLDGRFIAVSDMPWNSIRKQVSKVTIGEGITEIGDYTFYNLENLTTVTFPSTLEVIGDSAFEYNQKIASLKFPSGLKSIGEMAFYQDYALTTLTIPGSVEKVGYGSFWYCTNLTKVVMQSGVKSIGDLAFYQCSKLTDVTIPSTVKEIAGRSFWNTPFEQNWKDDFVVLGDGVLVMYNGRDSEVTVPSTVKVIAKESFRGNSYTKRIVLPSTVTKIGVSAFSGMSKLEEVVIPSSVQSIGKGAFTSTPFEEMMTDDFVILAGHILYKYNGKDTANVVIPSQVDVIGANVFFAHTEITSVTLPSKLKEIGDEAFLSCIELKSMTIPSTVKTFGMYSVGYRVSNVTTGSIYVQQDFFAIGVAGSALQTYCDETKVRFLTKADLTGTIGDGLQWTVDLSKKTLTISGTGAIPDFGYSDTPWDRFCYIITRAIFKDGVTSIGARTLYNCTSLTTITLGNTMETINNSAFYNLTSLKSLTLPASVKTVDGQAMQYCSAFEKYNVSSDNPYLKSVDGVLFTKDLKTMVSYPTAKVVLGDYDIPDGVQLIRAYAFAYDCKVTSIVVPESVVTVDSYGFYGRSIKKIRFLGEYPVLSSSSFISYYSSNVIDVIYYSGKAGWSTEFRPSYFPSSIHFIDCEEAVSGNIHFDTTSIGMYCMDTEQINVISDIMQNKDFTWKSSNCTVANVNNEGVVEGVGVGKATITATSIDGSKTLSCTVTVSGRLVLADRELFTLPEDWKNYRPSRDMMVFTVPGGAGLYSIQGSTVRFYSFYTTEEYEFPALAVSSSVEVCGTKLYAAGGSQIWVYDLLSMEGKPVVSESGTTFTAVGADTKGRIFATYNNGSMYVMSVYSSAGKKLSTVALPSNAYRIAGVDLTAGEVYYEGYYEYYSWGFEHDMTAMYKVSLEGNTLTSAEAVVGEGFNASSIGIGTMIGPIMFGQNGFSDHTRSLEYIKDGVFAISSPMLGSLHVLSSVVTDEGTKLMNAEYPRPQEVTTGEKPSADLTADIGTRCTYNSSLGIFVAPTDRLTLSQLNLDNSSMKYSTNVAHPVFALVSYNDYIVAVEKENGQYYLEMIRWKVPTKLTLSVAKSTIPVGEDTKVTVTSNSSLEGTYEYSSSDSSIASVTPEGVVVGWKAGQVVITVKDVNSTLTATVTVTVKANATQKPSVGAVTTTGQVTNNVSDNTYTVYGNVVNSYWFTKTDGTYERVEAQSNNTILVESYSADFVKTASKTITGELSFFGGAFSGETYNYVVYGQKNTSESDSVEVLRIVKYSKAWKRLGACSVYGANTYIPFDAGSCRMTEANGELYIHTCHEMYAEGDGVHHQANMTYQVNEANMTMTQCYYDVMNLQQAGYVSHSFNQFVATDGTYLYRVDHGDASPRGVAFSRIALSGKLTDIQLSGSLAGFGGGVGNNATGASIGGLALSKDKVLVAINSVDQTNYSAYGNRNIIMLSVPKKGGDVTRTMLTNYTAENGITVGTPQLVRINDYQFLVMWEETKQSTGEVYTQMILVGDDGQPISTCVTTGFRLSDCQPVRGKDGLISWYVTDGKTCTIYAINPYDIQKFHKTMPLSESQTMVKNYGEANVTLTTYKDLAGKITYTSDNTGVVTVSSTGIMKFVGVGTATVTVSVAESMTNFAASTTIKVTVNRVNLSDAGITCTVTSTHTYTGDEQLPDLKVTYGNKTLVKGTDYVLDVYDNIDAGTAGYTLAGRGNYKGYRDGTFTIAKATQLDGIKTAYTIACDKASLTLKLTAEGALTYTSSDTKVATVTSTGTVKKVGPGTVTITVKAAATTNYKAATKKLTFTVGGNGHQIVVVPGVKPTYTTGGISDGSYCSICNTTLSEQVKLDRLALPFTDVKAGATYESAVRFMLERRIMTGTSETTFSPERSLTRAQMVTLLYKMEGYPKVTVTEKPYSDTPLTLGTIKGIAWAKENHVVDGYADGTFHPSDELTRQQFIAMLFKYAKYKGLDTTVKDKYSYKACSDQAAVSSTFANAMSWAYERGFIGSNGKLSPKDATKRSDAAIIVMRFVKKYNL